MPVIVALMLLFVSPLILAEGAIDNPGISRADGFSRSDFQAIACASTRIDQIFMHADDMEDIEIAEENQIKLYEGFSNRLCMNLSGKVQDIEFLSYNENESMLEDAPLWREFDSYFAGADYVSREVCRSYAEKLEVDGVITSSLTFSYYENLDESRNLEVLLEGKLIDLQSGAVVWQNKSRCQRTFSASAEDLDIEFDCFEQVALEFVADFAASAKDE